jgi:hypothetical protein
MSAEEEANQFLELLVGREDLEIEEGHAAAELVPGVVEILKQPISPARVAAQLSEWLLDQEQVADLYIDDDSLAELLAEW